MIIDTDILIWILRGREDIRNQFEDFASNYNFQMCITPIQTAEIISGIKPDERIDTELFLDALHVINIDSLTGRVAGEYIKSYKKSFGITLADAFIAASVKISGRRLWTLNFKHYPMLTSENFI